MNAIPRCLQGLFVWEKPQNQEIALQEHVAEIVLLTEFEKEALPLLEKNIQPTLSALPKEEASKIEASFRRADPLAIPQFFSRLILTLWLQGELPLQPLAGISPSLVSCVLEGSRNDLSKLLWQKGEIGPIFSADLTEKNVDSALKFMGSHEIRTLYGLRNGIDLPWPDTPPQMLFFESDSFLLEQHGRFLQYQKALSYNPDTFFKSLTPTDKIKLWDKVGKSYTLSANSNHAGLYALIDTDPILKKNLERKNGWNELEESLRGETVLDLLKEHLSRKPYPGIVGKMLDSEYAAIVSQATAHAKIITTLQNTSKDEQSRFLAAADLLISQFSEGNRMFSSLVQPFLSVSV